MIYKRDEYIEQAEEESSKFPVKHIETMTDVKTGEQRFVGQVTLGLQTPAGVQQIPVSFEITAGSIADAFKKFDECAEPRIEEARKGIEEEIGRLRREAGSRIVRPGEVGLGGASPSGLRGGPTGAAGGGLIFDTKR